MLGRGNVIIMLSYALLTRAGEGKSAVGLPEMTLEHHERIVFRAVGGLMLNMEL